jgi:hypothetical protein
VIRVVPEFLDRLDMLELPRRPDSPYCGRPHAREFVIEHRQQRIHHPPEFALGADRPACSRTRQAGSSAATSNPSTALPGLFAFSQAKQH